MAKLLSKLEETFDFDEDDIDNLETIFSIIQKKSIEKWKSAQFEFTSDGDCEISFAY